MNYQEAYRQKLTTADEAVKCVQSGMWLDYGWSICTANALDRALAARMGELRDIKIRGGILTRRPAIFDVPDAADHFTWNSWHMSGIERKAVPEGFCLLRAAAVLRAAADTTGKTCTRALTWPCCRWRRWTSTAGSTSAPSAPTWRRSASGQNRHCGGQHGTCRAAWAGLKTASTSTQVDGMCGGRQSPHGDSGGGRRTVETHLAWQSWWCRRSPNGACLQLGIGSMPNAIGKMIAESELRDLGVHTEMYVDAFVDMARPARSPACARPFDRGRQVFAFGAGTQKLYDFINNNPECMTAPVSYVNDIARHLLHRQLHLHQRRGGHRPVRAGFLGVLRHPKHLRRRRPAGLCAGGVSLPRRQELHLLLLHLSGQKDRPAQSPASAPRWRAASSPPPAPTSTIW
jgi:hypothetical protein